LQKYKDISKCTSQYLFLAERLSPALSVARPALGGEDAVLGVVDDGGGNGDVFHHFDYKRFSKSQDRNSSTGNIIV
jgi:hypothetical protein